MTIPFDLSHDALRNLVTAPGADIAITHAQNDGMSLRAVWPHPVSPRLTVFLNASAPCVVSVHGDENALAEWHLQDPRAYTIDIPGPARQTLDLRLEMTPAADRFPLVSLRLAPADLVDTDAKQQALPEAFADFAMLDDAKLIRSFESIGNNCELGIVQRQLGTEPLDLYRFSAVPLGWILYGIDRAFENIDASDAHEVTLEHRPDGQHYYYVWQRDYRIQHETGIRQDLKSPTAMKRESMRRMHYLAWRLMGSLSEGARILTYRSERWLEPAELLAFSDCLHRHGPAFGLVVHEADADHPPAGPTWIAPNLLRATLPRFAHPACVVETIEVEPWLALCREAYQLAATRRAESPHQA
ncbi:hypothetical protein [Tanticharoenia sakaeratensis]|uniref:Uncharacterized protein n=1 Tax=Tanticharoenia sakaeratensis NBRC 103193 TaxID=1231623 RepID=A0A0D6MNH2_9PROT|nr:hypothetical protein [Tanticharoenia sakaeratensis]GAN54823.1 hypothetical protein Tasa_031_041 [Tanticharoenia sakaeratensis NBRC 103193]